MMSSGDEVNKIMNVISRQNLPLYCFNPVALSPLVEIITYIYKLGYQLEMTGLNGVNYMAVL